MCALDSVVTVCCPLSLFKMYNILIGLFLFITVMYWRLLLRCIRCLLHWLSGVSVCYNDVYLMVCYSDVRVRAVSVVSGPSP